MFDGSIERLIISCITEHEDYTALTNKTVLSLVGPLLRCRNGRSYRHSANQSENEQAYNLMYLYLSKVGTTPKGFICFVVSVCCCVLLSSTAVTLFQQDRSEM